jgi:membrane protease YdiL (CAAX protease family)
MRQFLNRISPAWEFAIVIGLAFGYLILISIVTFTHPATRPHHNDASLFGLIVYEGIAFVLLIPFLAARGWTPRKIGLAPSLRDTGVGLGLFLGSYLVWMMIWAATVAISPTTAQAAAATQVVAPGISLAIAIFISLVNAVFEEVFVCGYVIAALKRKDGHYLLAVNASVAIRLLYHLYQGPLGVISIIPLGLIFAYWFAKTGRLWPVLVAHAALDLVGLLAYAKW